MSFDVKFICFKCSCLAQWVDFLVEGKQPYNSSHLGYDMMVKCIKFIQFFRRYAYFDFKKLCLFRVTKCQMPSELKWNDIFDSVSAFVHISSTEETSELNHSVLAAHKVLKLKRKGFKNIHICSDSSSLSVLFDT